ncbi:TPA: DUF1524 domain-containing protein [Pasteurella multocida]|nr:DUF1524 domain-containing protein [Pasteurella multocida]
MAMKVSDNVLALDELFPQVKDFVIEHCYASISEIQRKFRVGFNRATRIVEQLEANGVITEMNEEGVRLSLIVTDEQQAWWNALPVLWKKIFTTHIYHGDKLFTPAKQFYEPSAEIELRRKTDLIHVFCLTEIGFYKGPSLDYIPDLRYFNRLERFSIPNFQSMIDYIFERVLLIRIKCVDESFAIKLFSVLNDRGLDLNPTDIIKAYLLQKLNCKTDRESFIEVWKRIENLCKQSKENMQNLFNLYLFYSTAENPRNSLQEEYKIKLKDKEPHSLILDIENFAKNLVEIVSDNFDSDISLLKYLPNKLYWKAILATAKQKNYRDFDLLKNLIMRYFYQSWIAEGTSSRVKQTSFNIIKEVKKNSNIVDIKNVILKNLEKYESYQSFLPRQNVYNKSWHKPVLFLLEYNTQEKMSFVEISNDIHTEHILPKEWKKDDLNWSQYFTENDAKEFINSLGNLTLLSGIKNIQASNRDYVSKVDIYDGKGIDGKTRFNITQDIMKKYPKNWSVETIKERRDDMVSKIISYLTI